MKILGKAGDRMTCCTVAQLRFHAGRFKGAECQNGHYTATARNVKGIPPLRRQSDARCKPFSIGIRKVNCNTAFTVICLTSSTWEGFMAMKQLSVQSKPEQLRAAMLPGAILDFCNRTTPQLIERHGKLSAQLDRIIREVEDDLQQLPDAIEENPERDDLINSAILKIERATKCAETLVKYHATLTGGGAAAVWVAAQRKLGEVRPDDVPSERIVNQRRPLGCKAPIDVD